LCPADARALEALCEAGFDRERVPAELRGRADRCAAVLGLLSCGPRPECDESLIDATLVRAAALRRTEQLDELVAVEEDALEALVAAGFDPARCPAGVRARAARQAEMLAALNVPIDADGRESLIGRTLERVLEGVQSSERRMRLDSAPRLSRANFRWGDLISVAALLLVASAVVTPMVGAVRNYSQQRTCQAGMGLGLAQGFKAYANDFREALPIASPSPAGKTWWQIGTPAQSNSANVFVLIRAHYAQPADLACPGNAHACRTPLAPTAQDWSCSDEVSFSYQNLFAAERPRWTQPASMVVIADRSPVTVRAMRHELINPVANSDNHAGRGENALFNDGLVRWLKSPVLSTGDNIWLPRTVEEIIAQRKDPTRADPLRGTEAPTGASDAFLSP